MALDALRSTLRHDQAPAAPVAEPGQPAFIAADPTVAIGTDAAVHGCPTCGRAIPRGAGRCDGCGQRLVLDVPLARASTLVGSGLVAGILATLLVVNLFAPPAAPAAADDRGSGPGSGETGTAGALVVPAGAAAALRGTTAINGRLVAQATPLAKAIAAKRFTTGDVVKVLRQMSIDARAGAGMVKAFATWPEAVGQQAALAAFYDELTGKIETGLSASVRSSAAYKNAAKAVLASLREIPALDADGRVLASQFGLDLVQVAIPEAAR